MPAPTAPDATLPLHMRRLVTRGGRALDFTALGFGAAPLGNMHAAMTDEAAHATLRRALALGIGYFDVAPLYGLGLAETRLGAVIGPASPTT